MVRDQSADREITGHLPPRNLPDERSHPLPLTGTGACWSEAGPVTVRAVGEVLGLSVEVRGKLEPLRAKLNRLADHFHKRWYRDTRLSPDDRKHLERRMVADGKDAEVLHLNTTSEGR